jgi:hypothetical protein
VAGYGGGIVAFRRLLRVQSEEIQIGGNDEDDEAYSKWLHMRKSELEERRCSLVPFAPSTFKAAELVTALCCQVHSLQEESWPHYISSDYGITHSRQTIPSGLPSPHLSCAIYSLYSWVMLARVAFCMCASSHLGHGIH